MSTTLPSSKFMPSIQEEPSERLIDTYHQLACTSSDVQDIMAFYAKALRKQAVESPVMALLGNEGGGADQQWERLSDAMQEAFASVAQHTLERRQKWEQTAESLLRLHQGDVARLVFEANSALQNGMRTTGRDRQENLRDALRLLQGVQANAISTRDYTVWFNLGWIQWKLQESLNEAEEAFYQASRLSASADPEFQAYSLRHLAYIQYLRGQLESAYDSTQRALELTPNDADTLYDAARYAARTGRETEALQLLNRCFEQSPLVFAFAFAEDDFAAKKLDARVSALMTERKATALTEARQEVQQWIQAVAEVEEAARNAGVSITIPTELSGEAALTPRDALAQSNPDYFSLLALRSLVLGKAGRVRAIALDRFQEERETLITQIERSTRQVEKILADRKLWQQTVKQIEVEAKQGGFPLTDVSAMARMKLRMLKVEHRYNMSRVNYDSAKDNLAQIEEQIKENVPTLHESIRKAKERRGKVDEAREWLESRK